MTQTIVDYFESLKRCDLNDINTEIRRLCLNRSQTTSFEKDGVLVVENVFGDDYISGALSALHRLELLVENHNTSCQDINLEATGGGFRGQHGTMISYEGKIRKVMNLLDHGDEFKEMAMYPPLLRIVTGLLGSDFRLHSKGFLMNKPPGVSTEKPWHQDSAYFDSDNTVITIWIPLQDVGEMNACLKAIPGSQSWGAIQHIGSEAQLNLSKLSLEMVRSYPVRKGGVCIMDKNTAHYSGKNESSNARRALIFRYEKISGSVCSGPISPNGSTGDPVQSFTEKLAWARDWIQTLDGSSGDEEGLRDALKLCQDIQQTTSLIIKRCHANGTEIPGPAVSSMLIRGEKESSIEKTHLITARVCRNVASDKQIEFLDMGTDFSYPFYDVYPPTQAALRALGDNAMKILHYPSSFGPRLETGHVANLDYLRELVQFAKKNSILVVHDMDSWYTHHQIPGRLHNILEVPGAMDCCVTVLSISKEFGLPGLRVGLIAGNSDVINVIRVHNSTFAVMIPDVCQTAAQAALEGFCKGDLKVDINAHVTAVLQKTKEGWRSLGWPEEEVHLPSGGFKYLVAIPPGVQPLDSFSGVELLDFYIASRASVKLSTSRSFNPTNDGFLRVVLMQNPSQVDEVFKRLRGVGIDYDMVLPEGLAKEYESFLLQNGSHDF